MREFTDAWPFAGVVAGDNLQFFERPNGRFAVGIFGYETTSNWEDWHDRRTSLSKVIDGGPTGVIGVGLSATYGISYGISKDPVDNYDRTSRDVVESWAGISRSLTIGLPFFVGFSGFESEGWAGVTASVGPGTLGFVKSREQYHLIVGPLVVSSEIEVATVAALYIANYHWGSSFAKYVGSKLKLPTDDPWFGDPGVDVVW